MAYRIRKNKSITTSVQKVAREQARKAMGEIDNDDIDRHEVVHQVRKRCKKLRGLIRLVRPNFNLYKEENGFLRDAARELSNVRDAQSIIESFDALCLHNTGLADDKLIGAVREELVVRKQEVAEDEAEIDKKLEHFYLQMKKLHGRIDSWQVEGDGFAAISGGLQKTYHRGRKAFAKAYENPTTENFHEWRKRVKYHWYHVRLLRNIWPEMLKVQRKTADHLASLLGDDHDLAVLRDTLAVEAKRFGGRKRLRAIFDLIDGRRKELQAEAYLLGELLYAENKQQLAGRFGAYWHAWKRRNCTQAEKKPLIRG